VMLLPLFIGRKFLSDERGHRVILMVVCIAGVIYCLPALYEVRMSPQLNRMIYGFFPHSWIQHIRGGGFRPLVFLNHGLNLGIFLACSIIAAGVLIRGEKQPARRYWYMLALLWLLGTLVLAKTLTALLIALLLLPVVLFLGVRQQLLVVGLIAALTLFYPILRGAHLVPTDEIVSRFEAVSPERAASLLFRFENEDILLERANERPVFGWGGNARSRIFDERGRDLSVTDGQWVIVIGQGGWIGYVTIFGLLTLPLMFTMLRRRRLKIDRITAGLCVMIAANVLDLLPNSSLSPVLWLAAGAILGRLEAPRKVGEPEAEEAAAAGGGHARPVSRYSRFPQTKRREA